MSRVKVMLDQFVGADSSKVPLPGSGETRRRFEVLSIVASRDLSVGRLAEGHLDALAILAEAGSAPSDVSATYGVWAARAHSGGTSAKRVARGWEISGRKEFCSGSGLIDRALVTADTPEGNLLFDIALDEHVTATVLGSWPAIGMADSVSATLEFKGPVIAERCVVGGFDFYTKRPGFWFGAAGVAACWYGGALGLIDNLMNSLSIEPSDSVMAEVGKAMAQISSMRAILASTADAIDQDPKDEIGLARYRALIARQVVHGAATEVLVRISAAGGARPLCHDPEQARRAADLYVYLSQHHGASDAVALGQVAREVGAWR